MHRPLLKNNLCPTQFTAWTDRERGQIGKGKLQCRRAELYFAHTKKLWVTISVLRGDAYDKVYTQGNSVCSQSNCTKLFFQLHFCSQRQHSFDPHSTLEIPFFQNQTSWSPWLSAISQYPFFVVFLAVSLAHAEHYHLVLMAWYFTHMPPPRKIPWATWFTIYSNLAMCLFFIVVAPTDVNPLFHKGSQLPFSLKARWLWHLPASKTFNPT